MIKKFENYILAYNNDIWWTSSVIYLQVILVGFMCDMSSYFMLN